MYLSIFQVIIPIFALAVNALAQVVSFRVIPALSLLKSEYLGFISGLVTVFACEFYVFPLFLLSGQGSAGILIVNLVIYLLLSYCYFHFINLGETGRRIRILRELREAENGLSREELLRRYSPEEIIQKRIDRLAASGQIKLKTGRYYTDSSFVLLIARFMVMMKLMIIGKASEFD